MVHEYIWFLLLKWRQNAFLQYSNKRWGFRTQVVAQLLWSELSNIRHARQRPLMTLKCLEGYSLFCHSEEYYDYKILKDVCRRWTNAIQLSIYLQFYITSFRIFLPSQIISIRSVFKITRFPYNRIVRFISLECISMRFQFLVGLEKSGITLNAVTHTSFYS